MVGTSTQILSLFDVVTVQDTRPAAMRERGRMFDVVAVRDTLSAMRERGRRCEKHAPSGLHATRGGVGSVRLSAPVPSTTMTVHGLETSRRRGKASLLATQRGAGRLSVRLSAIQMGTLPPSLACLPVHQSTSLSFRHGLPAAAYASNPTSYGRRCAGKLVAGGLSILSVPFAGLRMTVCEGRFCPFDCFKMVSSTLVLLVHLRFSATVPSRHSARCTPTSSSLCLCFAT